MPATRNRPCEGCGKLLWNTNPNLLCRQCYWERAPRKSAEEKTAVRQASQKAHYDRRRKQLDELKAAPCVDCDQSYPPCVMDFDHRPDEEKVFGIGEFVTQRSWSRVLVEIAKCDLVCANCHRLRTQKRLDEARGAF